MAFDPNKHNRRSIRLPGFDYAQPGSYYVTIITQRREQLFGRVENEAVVLNDAGRMIERWWRELLNAFKNVGLDQFVVMPNHFHGVVTLAGLEGGHAGQGGHPGPPLHRVVGWFKTMTTNEYIRGVDERGWAPFEKRLWQRGYYERIVRDEEELERIREYIETNPLHWATDMENVAGRPERASARGPSDDIEVILGTKTRRKP